jgi:hypothetical protein
MVGGRMRPMPMMRMGMPRSSIEIMPNENILDENYRWEKLKAEYPIGHKFHGRIFRVERFGVFLDLGHPIINNYKMSGIIDIITKGDDDSSGLPIEYDLWPKIGQEIHCKVIWYRDSIKEISLAILNDQGG